MKSQITIKQAYKAMFIFIRRYYYRKGEPTEIGNLLSDIQLLSHLYDDIRKESDEAGLSTADPASWEDWLEAIDTILREENEDKGA